MDGARTTEGMVGSRPIAVAAEAAAGSDLLRTTWALAWPVIFTFSIESFVGLCDMLMVGRLGPRAVAGVGVGVQILGGVDSVMFAVGTGTLAIVARQVGGRDLRGAEETLGQSILAAMALSLLAVVPVRAWAPALVGAFHVQPEVVPVGVSFLRIVMLGVPAGAALFVMIASLRGAGDTRTPLLIGLVVGVVNVLLAYVLIFGRLVRERCFGRSRAPRAREARARAPRLALASSGRCDPAGAPHRLSGRDRAPADAGRLLPLHRLRGPPRHRGGGRILHRRPHPRPLLSAGLRLRGRGRHPHRPEPRCGSSGRGRTERTRGGPPGGPAHDGLRDRHLRRRATHRPSLRGRRRRRDGRGLLHPRAGGLSTAHGDRLHAGWSTPRCLR